MNSNLEQENISSIIEIIHKELNPEYYKGLASIFFALNINGPVHDRRFAYEYMKYVYMNVSKIKAKIMAHTGYSKYNVEKFLKEIKQESFVNKSRTNNIFTEFIHKLRSKAMEMDNHEIPKYGNNSFSSIFAECDINDKTFTIPSVIESLEKCGCIETSKNTVKFLASVPVKRRNVPTDIIRQLSNTINRFTSTQLHNMNAKKTEDALFEQTVISIDVEDYDVPEAIKLIDKSLRKAHKKTRKIIDSCESIKPTNANHAIGFGIYIFKTKRE